MKKNSESFWKNGLSIDESRVSMLIVMLVMWSGIAAYQLITSGDISINIVQIIIALITAIAGVNIADSFAGRQRKRDDDSTI